ncbi:MAG: MerR family transcriptional regulator [Solirubrobacterales bacterium]
MGQVADRSGVTSSSIRYYESIGLLPRADRESGQRRYDSDVLRTIEMIGVAQKAGFSLREIKQLMDGVGDGVDISSAMKPLAARKLTEVNAMLKQGELMKHWLEVASGCDCASPDECSLFTDPSGERGPLQVTVVPGKGGCRK